MNQRPEDWMYIRSISTGNVVTASTDTQDRKRSQVWVRPLRRIDEELWRWDGQFIRNKATGLVLDIRKGRLRLMQETEICLYDAKPVEEAHNQLWGVRNDAVDMFGRQQPGSVIYSVSNSDWVLDIQQTESEGKLILFPYQSIDNDNQRWELVSMSEIDRIEQQQQPVSPIASVSSPISTAAPTPSTSTASSSPIVSADLAEYFAHGLSPAKRGSQSSVTMLSLDSFRDSHQTVYVERNMHVSDKTIAMAAAFETWQKWKREQTNADQFSHDVEKARTHIQSMAQAEALRILDHQLSNHKDTVLGLAPRFVVQLCEQSLASP